MIRRIKSHLLEYNLELLQNKFLETGEWSEEDRELFHHMLEYGYREGLLEG